MNILTRKQILDKDDTEKKLVDLTEWWGGAIYVRRISSEALDMFEIIVQDRKETNDNTNIRALIASLTACGEDGALLFSESDIVALGRKSGQALDRIVNAALELNPFFTGNYRDELKKN